MHDYYDPLLQCVTGKVLFPITNSNLKASARREKYLMKYLEELDAPAMQNIVNQFTKTKREKLKASYNLFTLSSYNCSLENYHSDIIASLLKPEGGHGKGDAFLRLFLDYCANHYSVPLRKEDFKNASVVREKGRIDIWIKDERTRQSIIIENKINNAPDMENQIDRYYEYAKDSGYCTKAIIYLSLDGRRKAPRPKQNIEPLIHNIGAFTNAPSDLVTGWLRRCIDDFGEDPDCGPIFHQYIKLLKHLANNKMDTDTMENFYQYLCTRGGMETVTAVTEMNARIPGYRKDRFAEAITDHSPFKTRHTMYSEDNCMFCDYVNKGDTFKLDIYFHDDGSAELRLCNQNNFTESGRESVRALLKEIDRLSRFSEEDDGWYERTFSLDGQYGTMAEVDASLIAFVRELMNALKNR